MAEPRSTGQSQNPSQRKAQFVSHTPTWFFTSQAAAGELVDP